MESLSRSSVINKYKGLVYYTIGKYSLVFKKGYTLTSDDIFSYGLLGLSYAIESYDNSKLSFESYASNKIKNTILDGIRKASIVSQYYRDNYGTQAVSASTPYGEDGDTLADILVSSSNVMEEYDVAESKLLAIQLVGELTVALKPKHKRLLRLRYNKGLPYKDIAREFNCSIPNVVTMHSKLIKKLQNVSKNRGFV